MSHTKAPIFRQPKPFFVIFLIELWERFGFYSMQVLMTQYLVVHFGYTKMLSDSLYSAFVALIYAFMCIGGYIGDKVLGTKRTMVMGAVFLATGYFLLGYGYISIYHIAVTYLGMGFIVVGNGLFKANPSSLLSKCYDAKDPRLDGAFTLYYMAINIGSFVAMVFVPIIANQFGWNWGFWVACLGLIVGIVNYYAMYNWVHKIDSKVGLKPVNKPAYIGILLGSVVVACACAVLLKHLSTAHIMLAVAGVVTLAIFIYLITAVESHERPKMIVALILILEGMVFFVLYQQMPTSLNFFAIDNMQHSILGIAVDPKTFQALDPFWVLILSPILAYIYGALGRKKKDLTMPAKFTLGMFFCAIGFSSLYVSTFFADAHGLVSSWWMVLFYFFQGTGELMVSGLGLAMVARLVPQRIMGFIMGTWFMATAIAAVIGGYVAGLANVPENIPDPVSSLHIYGHVFMSIGIATFVVACVMLALVPYLKKKMMMHH